jgi:hypothetical protein
MSVPSAPTLTTITGLIAAINATTGKSGSTYYCGPVDKNGEIPVFRVPSGGFAPGTQVFQVVWNALSLGNIAATDANATGIALAVKLYSAASAPSAAGVSDSVRYVDAYQFLNMLAAN